MKKTPVDALCTSRNKTVQKLRRILVHTDVILYSEKKNVGKLFDPTVHKEGRVYRLKHGPVGSSSWQQLATDRQREVGKKCDFIVVEPL